jgi:tRNA-binding EMAP/Myf-like protein
LLKIRLDDGTPEGRQVCAGIKAWYDPATLVGMQVIICANLEPRQLRGEISQGMILAASDMKIVALAPVELITAVDGAAAPDAIPAAAPAAKPGADERDVVILTVARAVTPGSRVS